MILLVEDDDSVRQLIEQVVTGAGYECIVCESGEQALGHAASSELSAAVVDLSLPGIDGVELATRLKAARPDDPLFPVILISGSDHPRDRVRALTAGCDDFLAKPLDIEELLVRLRTQLRRRAEVGALAHANRTLRELERRKRDLTALVVHDLRSPLAGVVGAAELLRGALAATPPDLATAQQLTEQIELFTAKALSLVASMLDVEELEQGMLVARVEEVWVAEYLAQLARPYRVTIGARGLALAVEATPGLRARFDPGLIGRVIENLLDNGVRYAARRGNVVLRAAPRDGQLCIEVGNDGPAVPAGERERIFDRYFQIEARRVSARENRGLGLYFCRLAVEAHGGTIAVDTEPAFPCLFQLRLPQPA